MNDMESIFGTLLLGAFIYFVVRRVQIKDKEDFEKRDN
ncbi:MAG: hypothetical protein ACI9IP_002261 [Arcticibacterium sp.]|jgi:hypothetical protein